MMHLQGGELTTSTVVEVVVDDEDASAFFPLSAAGAGSLLVKQPI